MVKFVLSPNDIRKIAANVPNCQELQTEACPDILCFLLVDMMDEPCRIQVYCRSGTVGTCRVLNNEVREIFQRKCNLRQVHEIFHQPMLLPNVDPKTFNDNDNDEEREPKNHHRSDNAGDNMNDPNRKTNRKTLIQDEQMVDIGLTILASEFDSLMYNFKSILRDRERHEEHHELELQQYAHVQQQQQQQQEEMIQMQQQKQHNVDIQMLKHKQRMRFQHQVRKKNGLQGKGSQLTQSKNTQQMKRQMQQQVRQIRQNQMQRTPIK